MRTQQGNAIHSRQLLVSVVPLILCCLLIFLCRIIICTEINYKTTHKRPQLSMFCTCFIAMHVGNNIMQCVANLCVHALFGSCHRHEKKNPGDLCLHPFRTLWRTRSWCRFSLNFATQQLCASACVNACQRDLCGRFNVHALVFYWRLPVASTTQTMPLDWSTMQYTILPHLVDRRADIVG